MPDPDLVDRFVGRYTNPNTAHQNRAEPTALFEYSGAGVGRVAWGRPFKQPCSVTRIIAVRAQGAGLGHMSPHDLRRNAAGILARAVDDTGAHRLGIGRGPATTSVTPTPRRAGLAPTDWLPAGWPRGSPTAC